MPHKHCYSADPFVYWSSLLGDGLTAFAYLFISLYLLYVTQARDRLGATKYGRTLGKAFFLFIFLCGLCHGFQVFTTHVPEYRVEAIIRLSMMLVSVATAIILVPTYRKLEKIMNDIQSKDLNRFRAVAETVADGLWDWDISTGNDWLSNRYMLSLGYSEDDVKHTIDDFIENLVHPEDREMVELALIDHLTNGTPYRVLVRLRRPDGTYAYRIDSGSCFRDEEGVPVRMMGTHVDVSELIEAREARDASLAEVNHFSYLTSHNIRTPVRNIHSFTTVLFDDYRQALDDAHAVNPKLHDPEELHTFITGGSKEILDLLSGLSEYTDVDSVRRRGLVPTTRIVETALTSLEERLDAAGAIVSVDVDDAYVHASEVSLARVLTEVLVNSIQFAGLEPPRIRIVGTVCEQKQEYKIEVSDKGIGLPKESENKVFDLLQKIDTYGDPAPPTTGAGFGLAIVRRIMQLHQGSAWATSEGLQQGCTIHLLLPIADDPKAHTPR